MTLKRRSSAKGVTRDLVDRSGRTYHYTVALHRGTAYSTVVGFISSFLGLGGGVIHVSLLVAALGFPTHIATATSHFVVTLMAAGAVATHVVTGSFAEGGLRRAGALSLGIIVGAQLGAHLSRRMPPRWIHAILIVALFALALRLALDA